jgi:hypothetical protein
MELTPYRSIPYPSEYEDPFVDSFDQLMEYLDRNLETRYSPVYGCTPMNPQYLNIPIGEVGDHRAAAGCPIRYRGADFDPWRYGYIREWNAEWGIALISGAPIDMGDTQFEVGGPSMVITRHLRYDGNWNHDPADTLFYTDQKGKFLWTGPAAYLVMACAVTDVENTGPTERVNVVRSANHSPYVSNYGPWVKVFTDNGWDGVDVLSNSWSYATIPKLDQYLFDHLPNGVGTPCFDLAVKGDGDPNAVGLSVELIFVLRGDQDQVCPRTAPSVQLTISGMPVGEDWQGLTDGVHTLCPTQYYWFNNHYTWYTHPYDDFRNEHWRDAAWYYGPYYPDRLQINATNRWTTDINSRMQFKWGRPGGWYQYTFQPSSGTTGFIQDRLFVSFMIGPTTFTLARGAGPWRTPPAPP